MNKSRNQTRLPTILFEFHEAILEVNGQELASVFCH